MNEPDDSGNSGFNNLIEDDAKDGLLYPKSPNHKKRSNISAHSNIERNLVHSSIDEYRSV